MNTFIHLCKQVEARDGISFLGPSKTNTKKSSYCVRLSHHTDVLSPCVSITTPLSDKCLKSPSMIASVSCFDSKDTPLEGPSLEFLCDF